MRLVPWLTCAVLGQALIEALYACFVGGLIRRRHQNGVRFTSEALPLLLMLSVVLVWSVACSCPVSTAAGAVRHAGVVPDPNAAWDEVAEKRHVSTRKRGGRRCRSSRHSEDA